MTEKINAKVTFRDFGSEIGLSIEVDLDIAKELCLRLILLQEELISVIELNFENATFFLRNSGNNFSTCTTLNLKESVFKGSISKNMLGYFTCFLLKYFRDGIAEAEHIDLDFSYANNQEVVLTINTKNYIMYSKEAIKKMLD